MHVQSTQTLKTWTIFVFFKRIFFILDVQPFFFEIKEDFILMIKNTKGLQLMKINLITHLSTFGSKVFLTLKTMDFENVDLTKVVHIYVIEDMNA